MSTGRILLVEDDRKIAAVVKAYLEAAGFVVTAASTAADARDSFDRTPPDLVVLDLMLPDGTGEELATEFRDGRDVPIIMATARASEEERLVGFGLGADDYIVKPFSPKELVARVKAVLRRTRADGTSPVRQSFSGGRLVIDGNAMEVVVDGRPAALTQTEFKLLSVLAGAPGKAFSRLELVERALGYQFEGYERSVDAHIKNMRHKLDDDPKQPAFIATVFGVGYRFLGTADGP